MATMLGGMRRPARLLAAATALAFTTSCATLLYPERKGNNAGPLDTIPLVVDILLFLPGLLPGVIALVVDFGTGAIYLNKGGGKSSDRQGSAVARKLELRVLDERGEVLARHDVEVEATAGGEPIALAVPELGTTVGATHVEVAAGQAAVRVPMTAFR
jgi:hypothetical protein